MLTAQPKVGRHFRPTFGCVIGEEVRSSELCLIHAANVFCGAVDFWAVYSAVLFYSKSFFASAAPF
jgi:hypothetical protein